jgi:peptidoglycan/xylan/chitin deacetylase (PgdA/CDA1 family)
MAVRATTFDCLLDYITTYCECLLPGEATLQQEAAGDRPRITLTFDDGWKDNFDVAFPISRKYGVRFAVFLCPQMMNCLDSFWTSKILDVWRTAETSGRLTLLRSLCGTNDTTSADALIQSLKHVPARERDALIIELQSAFRPYAGTSDSARELLSWPEVKNMSEGGVVFGSHTASHAILTDIPRDAAICELRESKRAIEAELNSCRWFAYPNGDWSVSVRELVAQAGYCAAFTNTPGIWRSDGNRFSIPRVNVWEGSVVGFNGRFSRLALEYAIFWKAQRAASGSRLPSKTN